MAFSTKYGQLDIPNIGDDEPVFVIRARDAIGLLTVKDYRSRASSLDLESIVGSVDAEIVAFEDWQEKNETKQPD